VGSHGLLRARTAGTGPQRRYCTYYVGAGRSRCLSSNRVRRAIFLPSREVRGCTGAVDGIHLRVWATRGGLASAYAAGEAAARQTSQGEYACGLFFYGAAGGGAGGGCGFAPWAGLVWAFPEVEPGSGIITRSGASGIQRCKRLLRNTTPGGGRRSDDAILAGYGRGRCRQ
jgi:hypothetical protein